MCKRILLLAVPSFVSILIQERAKINLKYKQAKTFSI